MKRARHVALVLAGVAALLLKSRLHGVPGGLGDAYLGNVAGSFIAFFVVAIGAAGRLGRAGVAAAALAVVEAFELTDGFGVMANVYDPYDLAANVLGVGLAWYVDIKTSLPSRQDRDVAPPSSGSPA